jgi:phosphoglycolate phosphatase-like HAD superfamily hydrolase
MHLVLFDIDGTLTLTNTISSDCFVEAMAQTFQITEIDTDWSKYRNVTERGCFDDILESSKGRPGTEEELGKFKNCFLKLLRDRTDLNNALFRPVPGAGKVLGALKSRADVATALATGAWLESAEIKLRRAGLDIEHMPIISGNDAPTRERILKVAEERLGVEVGVRFETKTYVGDAPWDLRAATDRGFHFIGVGAGKRAGLLRSQGAEWLVADFGRPEVFLGILDHIFGRIREHTPDP